MADFSSNSSRGSGLDPFRLPSPEAEAELVDAMKQGDEPAFEKLMRLHWSELVAYASRILNNRDRAEDIVQEAFLTLWTRREEMKRNDTVRPLLYRIVRNSSLNELRRLRNARNWVKKFGRAEPDPATNPQRRVEQSELGEIIKRAVDRLPPRRREVFILVRYHHLSYREVAEVLGLSAGTVGNQVSLAAQELRKLLERKLADPDMGPSGSLEVPGS